MSKPDGKAGWPYSVDAIWHDGGPGTLHEDKRPVADDRHAGGGCETFLHDTDLGAIAFDRQLGEAFLTLRLDQR